MSPKQPRTYRWVSCAKDVNWTVARERHLLGNGAITTVCGATGMGETVWRGNKTKPQCKECTEVAEKKGLEIR